MGRHSNNDRSRRRRPIGPSRVQNGTSASEPANGSREVHPTASDATFEAYAARQPAKRKRGRLWFIAGGVVLVLIVTGCVAWTKNVFNPVLPAAAWAQTCTPTQLRVVADPSIAAALRASAKGFDATTPCVHTSVTSQKSADTASALAVGGDIKADVWIPDSPAWEPRMQVLSWSLIRRAPVAEFGRSIASSPLVFATPSKNADAFDGSSLNWNTIGDGDTPVLLPEPAQNGSSLAALAEIKATADSRDDLAFSRDMIELSKTIPATVPDAFADAERASAPTVVVTTEQSVVAQNESSPSHQFFALYPSDGTVSVSYPYVRVAGTTTGDATKDQLISALERQFRSDSRTLARAGFRTADGEGFAAKGVVANPPKTSAALDGGAQVGILESWSSITVRSRMLVVVDTSGSMDEDADGRSRIDVFEDAASGMLQLLPPQTEMGVWTFSTDQSGTQPWAQRSPIASLDDPAHASDVSQVFGSLSTMVAGDTGLYDTVLAAVKDVKQGYDPHRINYVLVVTDGRNENPAGGLSLTSLVSQLKALNDPKKPVPVIMVGMGPDTDVSAMSQIANATVGAVYTAEQPQDITNVLVDALQQRTCRPYCS
ncbi:substrate-binding domain-containing protein [Humibacter albus]|uniref:substrate-binding domain-containing protein n=1 Tax=Humibacter albus TaxID=427754 RepID=UPI0003B4760A|nr:substrate-binding domain-containing protein [Humibacter albus]